MLFRGANYMTYGSQTIYLRGVNRMVLSHTEITEITERLRIMNYFRAFRVFCVTFKEKISEVDLAAFLLGGGMLLKDVVHCDVQTVLTPGFVGQLYHAR